MKNERTLENLRKSLTGKIFIYLKNRTAKEKFLSDARAEGYGFGEFGLPENIKDDIISLKKNKKLCYVGAMGKIEFQCNGGDNAEGRFHRIDYMRYREGNDNYYFYDDDSERMVESASMYHGNIMIIGDDCEKAAKFFNVAKRGVESYDDEESLLDVISDKYDVVISVEED